ncbi:hypothetical protein DPMN_050458 [Dreissena polymorpha]|uniref:Uncharacterized protein n=1 Tax=Dreissena polymorpha TaxID=45954 RepID=A0A9D4CH85_DREPO|nr:hypothetical protein DPMN_050458 [Dreissena polymorpha]
MHIDAVPYYTLSDSGADDEFALSAETSKLQDKLAQLQNEKQYLEVTSVTPKRRLPKVKSCTDEITRRDDRIEPRTEVTRLQRDLHSKTEEIDEPKQATSEQRKENFPATTRVEGEQAKEFRRNRKERAEGKETRRTVDKIVTEDRRQTE